MKISLAPIAAAAIIAAATTAQAVPTPAKPVVGSSAINKTRDLDNHEAGTAELGARSPIGFGGILSCFGKGCKASVEEPKVPWLDLDPADQAPWISKANDVLAEPHDASLVLHAKYPADQQSRVAHSADQRSRVKHPWTKEGTDPHMIGGSMYRGTEFFWDVAHGSDKSANRFIDLKYKQREGDAPPGLSPKHPLTDPRRPF